MFYSRGKNKTKVDIKLKDLYQTYKEHCINKNKEFLDHKLFSKITKEFSLLIREELLEGNKINLPFGLGILEIVKQRRKFKNPKSINWKATAETGIRLFHEEMFLYGVNWSKYNSRFKNKTKYKFSACRTFSRSIATKIKVEKKDYFLRNEKRLMND